MKFLDPLIVEHRDDGTWKLWFEFRCIADDGTAMYVQASFVTDMLSIPRFLWSIVSPTGQGGKAGVLHDWLLSTGDYTRLQCADYFLEALLSLGVHEIQAESMYNGVRANDLKVELIT